MMEFRVSYRPEGRTTRRAAPSPEPQNACRAVADAAAALGLREYDFFRLAHRRWFGRQPEEPALENAFARFMFNGIVPPWTTHLARQVLDAQAAGRLDATAFGASRYRDRPARPRHGILCVAGFAVVWAVLFVMIVSPRHPDAPSAAAPWCATPGGPEHPVAALVRLSTGRPPCPDVSDSSHARDR